MWRMLYSTDLATCVRTWRRVWVAGSWPHGVATAAAACGAAATAAGLALAPVPAGPRDAPAMARAAPALSPAPASRFVAEVTSANDANSFAALSPAPYARQAFVPAAFLPLPDSQRESRPGQLVPLFPAASLPLAPLLSFAVPSQPEQPVPVPEPNSLSLIAASLFLLIGIGRFSARRGRRRLFR